MASQEQPHYGAAELDYRLQAHLAMNDSSAHQKSSNFNSNLTPAHAPYDPRMLNAPNDGQQYQHSMDRARSHSGGGSEYSGSAAFSNFSGLAPRNSGTYDAGSASSRSLSMVFSDHTHDYPESEATSRSFASPPPGLPRSGSQNSGLSYDYIPSGAVAANSQGRSTPAIEHVQERSGGSSPHPSSTDSSSGRPTSHAAENLRTVSGASESHQAYLQQAASERDHQSNRQQWPLDSEQREIFSNQYSDPRFYAQRHDQEATSPQDARSLSGLHSPAFHHSNQQRGSHSASPLGPPSPASDAGYQGQFRSHEDGVGSGAPHIRAVTDQLTGTMRSLQSMTPVLRTGSVAPTRDGHFASAASVTPPLGSNGGSGAAAAASTSEYSIFIGDLSPDLVEADLVQQFLSPPPWPPSHPFAIAHAHALQKKGLYGPPPRVAPRPFLSTKSAKIMTDPANGISRGFGFVRFASEADCARALIEMQGVVMTPSNGLSVGRPLRVCTATPKNRTPGPEMQAPQPPSSSLPYPPSGLAGPYPNAPSPRPAPPTSASSSLHSLPPSYSQPSPGVNVITPPAHSNMSGGRFSHGYAPDMLSPGINAHTSAYSPLVQDMHKIPSSQYHRGSLLSPQAGQHALPPPRMAASFSGPSSSPLGTPAYGSSEISGGPNRASRSSVPATGALSGHSPTSSTSASVGPSANATASALDPHNTTVFVGGLSSLISEDTLKTFFVPFGEITYVKIPPGKGCGFVQFVRKADAERAIERMQGFPIGGGRIRLSWGRSQGDKAAVAAAGAAQRAAQLGHLAGLAGLTGLSPSQLAQLAGLSSALNAAQAGVPERMDLPQLASALHGGNISPTTQMGSDLNTVLLRQLSSAAAAGLRNDGQGGSNATLPMGIPVGVDRASAYGGQIPEDQHRRTIDGEQQQRVFKEAFANLSLEGRGAQDFLGSQHRTSVSPLDASRADIYSQRGPSRHGWEPGMEHPTQRGTPAAPLQPGPPPPQPMMSEQEYMQQLQQRGRPDLAHSNAGGGRRHSPHSLMQSNVFSPFSPSVSPAIGGNLELRGEDEHEPRPHQLAQQYIPESYSPNEYSRYDQLPTYPQHQQTQHHQHHPTEQQTEPSQQQLPETQRQQQHQRQFSDSQQQQRWAQQEQQPGPASEGAREQGGNASTTAATNSTS